MNAPVTLALDQGHGVRLHHDWWWDLTVPQAVVIAAVVVALVAGFAVRHWYDIRERELGQRRLEFNERGGRK